MTAANIEHARKYSVIWRHNEKKKRIDLYNQSPKLCKQCSQPLLYEDSLKKKAFCNNSCSASYRNMGRVRKKKIQICSFCKIEFSRKSHNKFCSIKCCTEYKRSSYLKEWKSGKINASLSGRIDSTYIREYIFNKYNNCCSICKWSERHTVTGKIPLQIDHKDGNSMNNKEENLRLLCPNCHSLTTTYGILNKGHGRSYRMKRYYEGKAY